MSAKESASDEPRDEPRDAARGGAKENGNPDAKPRHARRLIAVMLDEASIGRSSLDQEQECSIAIYDLLERNSFAVPGHDRGPFAPGPFAPAPLTIEPAQLAPRILKAHEIVHGLDREKGPVDRRVQSRRIRAGRCDLDIGAEQRPRAPDVIAGRGHGLPARV